jgi:hypothetical protein
MFRKTADAWHLYVLDLCDDSPAEAKRIMDVCTYTEVALAWANSRRRIEGIGYEVR